MLSKWIIAGAVIVVVIVCLIALDRAGLLSASITYSTAFVEPPPPPKPQLDKELYDGLMDVMANNPELATSTATSTATTTAPAYLWPVKTAPYPNYGAILPFNRVVAYYGNFLSPAMGVLGQATPPEMLARLQSQAAEWQAADPSTPVIPAIDYIAIAAQGSAGADGKYRARMSSGEVQKAIDLAKQINGIVILDIQVGWSTVQEEVPLLEQYLKLPNVHLALDPEFALEPPKLPGQYIGTMDAVDINFVADYLAQLVDKYDLPPKILIVHRFTEAMVTNYQDIKPLPQVQVVMDMDGYGFVAQKVKTYSQVIYPEPVQFTGLKLFYKNDANSVGGMMSIDRALKLRPKPIFIQYQ